MLARMFVWKALEALMHDLRANPFAVAVACRSNPYAGDVTILRRPHKEEVYEAQIAYLLQM